ncbi:unnamed protein product [Effrenium voratum]|uniref:Uncharacterized protein n=1 Tax=Effrenium voratum TaxID=2562239 RepID=A0AA36N925_9DINO|nr:unnamed protein product [Effrenium voratum]
MGSLRPWNLFGKTAYKVSTNAAASGVGPASSNLALQLSQARARRQAQEAGSSMPPFQRNMTYLAGPFSMLWALLLAARWRYSDEDRLRELEKQPGGAILLDVLAWRVAAHLGPYQIPNLCRAKMHEEPLRMLQEPVLLDSERMQALRRLGQLSQRRLAALSLAPPKAEPGPGQPLRAIEPLLLDAFFQDSASATRSPGTSADSHKDRQVPSWTLSGLVKARGIPWQVGPQGEELRATLLLQLLRTPANAAAAAGQAEVCQYLAGPGFKKKEDTSLPLKAYLLSGETHDLLRRGAKMVVKQRPGAVEAQERRERDTPSLQIKRDLRNIWTTIQLSAGWASFWYWQGAFTLGAALQLVAGIGGALAGTAVLEVLWRIEEQVIESEWYWEGPYSVPASGAMAVANCCALAWAVRFACIAPFLICRLLKDDSMDAHRTFEAA